MSRPDITAFINGNARGYHDAMRRVRSDTRATARDAEASFAAITTRLRGGVSGLIGALRGGPAGIAAALGIGSYVAAAKQAIDATLELGRAARTAGVSFEAYQELRHAAESSLVGVEALSDGLKEMQGRAEEVARTGKGPASAAFGRLGLDAKALADGLRQPDKMFETIIARLRTLDTASRINVAQQIFGGSAGSEFLGFLDDGAKGIDELRQRARDLGTVMEDDILRTAQEIDGAFRTIGQSIDGFVRPRVIRLAGDVVTLLEKIMAVENRRSSTLQREFTAFGKERLDNENEILRLREQQGQITGATAEMEKRLLDGTITALEERNRQIEALEKQRLDILDEREAPRLERPTFTPSTEDADPVKSRGGGARDRATKELERQRKAVEDVIAALKEEIALIGLSDSEQERLTALRRAGVEAASAEGETIMELIARKHRLLEVERQREEQQRRGEDAARQWGDMMVSQLDRIIDGSFDAKEAARMLVSELLRAAVTGEGLFANLFSGGGGGLGGLLGGFAKMMFGGGRAGGGDVTPGRIYRVNEYGEEFFSPASHGRVVPAGAGGSAQRLGVDVRVTADRDGLNAYVRSTAREEAGTATAFLAGRVGSMVDDRSETARSRGMRP